MKVKILKEGKYLDENLGSARCLEGAVLDVKGWYGSELIEQGLAEAMESDNVSTPKNGGKKVGKKKKTTSSSKKGGKAGAVNPGQVFLE